jgi:twitching motility protein PilT
MQAGKKHGMQTLADSLYTVYMQREVTLEECLRVSPDQNEFLRMVGEDVPEGRTQGAPATAGARR